MSEARVVVVAPMDGAAVSEYVKSERFVMCRHCAGKGYNFPVYGPGNPWECKTCEGLGQVAVLVPAAKLALDPAGSGDERKSK